MSVTTLPPFDDFSQWEHELSRPEQPRRRPSRTVSCLDATRETAGVPRRRKHERGA